MSTRTKTVGFDPSVLGLTRSGRRPDAPNRGHLRKWRKLTEAILGGAADRLLVAHLLVHSCRGCEP